MKTNEENRGCDFSETFLKLGERNFFIHHINKDRSLFHVSVIRPFLFLNFRVFSDQRDARAPYANV